MSADLFLHNTAGGRETHIARHGGHGNQIDIQGRNAGLGEGALSRFGAEIGGVAPLLDNVTLGDACALANPLVTGVNHLFQVLVGQHTSGDGATCACDHRMERIIQSQYPRHGSENHSEKASFPISVWMRWLTLPSTIFLVARMALRIARGVERP